MDTARKAKLTRKLKKLLQTNQHKLPPRSRPLITGDMKRLRKVVTSLDSISESVQSIVVVSQQAKSDMASYIRLRRWTEEILVSDTISEIQYKREMRRIRLYGALSLRQIGTALDAVIDLLDWGEEFLTLYDDEDFEPSVLGSIPESGGQGLQYVADVEDDGFASPIDFAHAKQIRDLHPQPQQDDYLMAAEQENEEIS